MQRWSGRRDSNPVYVSGWCLRQSPCPLPRLGPPHRRPVARSFLLTAPHGGKPFKSAMRGGDRRESNPCFLGGVVAHYCTRCQPHQGAVPCCRSLPAVALPLLTSR